MQTSISRRNVVACAIAGPVASIAPPDSDAELRRLWAKQFELIAAHQAAERVYRSTREAYRSELGALGDAEVRAVLWDKHGVAEPWNRRNETSDCVADSAAEIQHVKAHGLFGIGVKLVALCPEEDRSLEDYEGTIRSVLADIDRMLGTSFLAALSPDVA